jgi:hypothetical protein
MQDLHLQKSKISQKFHFLDLSPKVIVCFLLNPFHLLLPSLGLILEKFLEVPLNDFVINLPLGLS